MSVAFIDNVPFKHTFSAAYLKRVRKEIDDARKTTAKLTETLIQSIQAGNEPAKQDAVLSLLSHPSARLVSAICANRKLSPRNRKSLDDCLALSTTLDLFKPLTEIVPVRPMKKASGGYRMIHNHGLQHRTAQHLVKRVLDIFFVPRSFQFTHLGCHAAIKRTKDLIHEGYVHVAHLDITDFFSSFELEKLLPELPLAQEKAAPPAKGLPAQPGKGGVLPLPDEVVEYVVTGRHMAVRVMLEKSSIGSSLTHSKELLNAARLGIPQGSACSSIVAAYTVSHLKWAFPSDVALVNVADDFLLLAQSREARAKAVDDLVAAVGSLPGGIFKLKLKTATSASKGFRFLGHEIQFADGTVRVSPSLAADEELVAKLDTIDEKLGKILFPIGGTKVDKQAALDLLAKHAAILQGWQAAFSQCTDIEGYVSPYLESQATWLDLIGATEDDLKHAITPDMEYTPGLYAMGK
ncbi:hypothetical protein JDN40_01345 [Rhodomicrobium vannielii ATCC 17100]|uniref:hypothetical protein n=1 Tax=Rhodomicrobium vannielii TaxID=1069 RepID=UPI001919E6B9|nr:hypothetical protein [Rhodomicrobium vannielii]MBJ7532767.1 hypothetical protein [Rhodomicrobium vannielii ATCC 17100]